MAPECSLELGGTFQNSSAHSVVNFNYNPEQVCVDVYITPDTAVPAGIVIGMISLCNTHTGCVLEFTVGVKSYVPSPY